MTSVRVGAALYAIGPLQCPRCGRRDPTHLEGIGILRPTCGGKRCRCSWTAVRLPPGSTGRQLVDVIGPMAARIVLEGLDPRNRQCSDMDLEAIVLSTVTQEAISGGLYVQRAPDTPEPLMGWREAQHILGRLMPHSDDEEEKGAA